jgi:hypothetical protein
VISCHDGTKISKAKHRFSFAMLDLEEAAVFLVQCIRKENGMKLSICYSKAM